MVKQIIRNLLFLQQKSEPAMEADKQVITKKTGKYETEEGCLSLDGVRPCTRYKKITGYLFPMLI